MAEWFEAKAALNNQEKFASYCGRGLSEHKKRKPPLLDKLERLYANIQPSLFFELNPPIRAGFFMR